MSLLDYLKILECEHDVNPASKIIMGEIREVITPEMRVWEVGITPTVPSLDFACICGEYFATHPDKDYVDWAKQKTRELGLSNVTLEQKAINQIPFEPGTADVVLSLLGPVPHDTQMVYDALKPGGMCYVWKVGERDKFRLKTEFGKDEQGWRGYNCNLNQGTRMISLRNELRDTGFTDIQIEEFFYDCYYNNREDLVHFLRSIGNYGVRNFSAVRDRDILERISTEFERETQFERDNDGRIWVRKHEVLAVGRKPN